MSVSIISAYNHCRKITHQYHENFPIASWFLSRKIKRYITAIYAFARSADNIVDKGNLSKLKKLNKLKKFKSQLDAIKNNQNIKNKIFIALKHCIDKKKIPITPFYHLLDAFKQDITINRYQTFDEILKYCRKSANPIGYLLLIITDNLNKKNIQMSNSICTSLQLINFLQDMHDDLKNKNRLYLPLQELKKYNITINDLLNNKLKKNYHNYLNLHLNRIKSFYNNGYKLTNNIYGLFGLEIQLIIAATKYNIHELSIKKNAIKKINLLPVFWKALINFSKKIT